MMSASGEIFSAVPQAVRANRLAPKIVVLKADIVFAPLSPHTYFISLARNIAKMQMRLYIYA